MRTQGMWRATGLFLVPTLACSTLPPEFPRDDGGWSPPAVLLEEAARLGGTGRAEKLAAEERLASLQPEDRCRLLRAGLRLPDGDAAVACAAKLRWPYLNGWESARCVALLAPTLFRPGSPVDFEEFRSYLGSDELGAILRALPEAPWNSYRYADMKGPLAELHRIVRAGHIPDLCRLMSNDDEAVRLGAMECIWTTLPNTDRHRDEIARAFIELAERTGQPWVDPVVGESVGYPRLLRQVLRWGFLEWYGGDPLRAWAVRWAASSTPGPGDAELLCDLLRSEMNADLSPEARFVFRRAMGRLRDAGTEKRLESEFDCGGAGDVESIAVAASLAERGRVDALERLRSAAPESPLAFAVLAGLSPGTAAGMLRGRLLVRDPEALDKSLDWLEDALRIGRQFGAPIPETTYDGLEAMVLAAGLDGTSLARIAVVLPACRTRRIATAAIDDLRRRPPRLLGDDEAAMHGAPRIAPEYDALEFLEVASPDGFRDLLRGWAALQEPAATGLRDWAMEQLIALSDEPSASAIVHWLESRWDGLFEEYWSFNMTDLRSTVEIGGLAHIPGPEVEGFLRRVATQATPIRARAYGLAYLAVRQGLRHDAAWAIAHPKWSDRILSGEARTVLEEFCRIHPEALVEGLALAKPGERMAFLTRRRESRTEGSYLWVTRLMMREGDRAARDELWSAYRAGRYRWIDEAEPEDLTLGWDLSTIPFWLEEMESSCCRFNMPNMIFNVGFDFDPRDVGPDSVITPAASARLWWGENGRRLRWSVWAKRFVVGPLEDGESSGPPAPLDRR